MKLHIFIFLSFFLHLGVGILFLQRHSIEGPRDLAVVEISEISRTSQVVSRSSQAPFKRNMQPVKEAENAEASKSFAPASALSEQSGSFFEPVNVGDVSVAPKLLFKKKVPYPVSAGRAGVEGIVDLKIVVDQEGRVKEAEVVRGPGYGLDEAALLAVRDCLFSPALKDQAKVPVRMGFKYEFQLGEK